MAQLTEDSLLEAMQKDDIKGFDAQWGRYRLGRFPVLSALYLYKSKKILSAYEESFLKITNYEALREPVSISKEFSEIAGKCLRLYLSETVSPLEMLLILDQTKRLKRVYPLTKPSSAIKGRLKSIYSIKYSLDVKFEGNDIILDRRPLKPSEKKKIATACLCCFLAVAIAVVAPITAVTLKPKDSEINKPNTEKPDDTNKPDDTQKPSDGNTTEPVKSDVTELSQIDFSSVNEYTLKEDIVIPENYSVEKVNCKLNGGGKKLVARKGANLGELSGKLSDVTIESSGALFKVIKGTAEVKDVTVNVGAEVSTSAETALVALTNYGVIDGVTVNIGGKINALAGDNDGTEETVFGGVVLSNASTYDYSTQSIYRGVIKNCTVNYSDFSLVGEASANAVFGGVTGVNTGYVQDCIVTGEIVSDTFDIAGICYGNNGLLSNNINEAKLTQTSESSGWNPIASGIVLQNVNVVEYCENKGSVSAKSTCEQSENELAVSAAGIVYLNSGTIGGCKNSGTVDAKGYGTAFVGGIASRSYGNISYCFSDGEVSVKAKSIYAGGIFGRSEVYYTQDFFGYNFAWGSADHCICESTVSVIGEGYVGGIVGFVAETDIKQPLYDDEGTLVTDEEGNAVMTSLYFSGGVLNSYFTGECEAEHFGNIAGDVGENIYESNSYSMGTTEYHNFEGNYYLNNSFTAFADKEDKGATAQPEDEIKNSEGYKAILEKLKK